MAMTVSKPERRRFDDPDDRRIFPLGKTDVVTVGGVTLSLTRYERNWTWSEHAKPAAGPQACQEDHVGYLLAGHLRIKMTDGTQLDVGAGDLIHIPPGHQCSVVGKEPAVFLEILECDRRPGGAADTRCERLQGQP
jgi:hypothetical protein